jgi:hypothetical protein
MKKSVAGLIASTASAIDGEVGWEPILTPTPGATSDSREPVLAPLTPLVRWNISEETIIY